MRCAALFPKHLDLPTQFTFVRLPHSVYIIRELHLTYVGDVVGTLYDHAYLDAGRRAPARPREANRLDPKHAKRMPNLRRMQRARQLEGVASPSIVCLGSAIACPIGNGLRPIHEPEREEQEWVNQLVHFRLVGSILVDIRATVPALLQVVHNPLESAAIGSPDRLYAYELGLARPAVLLQVFLVALSSNEDTHAESLREEMISASIKL